MLDLKEEKQYERFTKLGQKLHIPTFQAFIELEVFDKDGKLIQRHKQRGHSWVRNAYNCLFSAMASKQATDGAFGAGLLNVKDTGGVVRQGNGIQTWDTSSSADDPGHGLRGAAAQVTCGIVVGTGVNAESFEDFVLQTLIAEGAGGGQMNYAQQEATAVSYGALVLTATLIRYINNNSGGAIGVEEVVLYCEGRCDGVTDRFWAQSRDKLGATVTVPNTGQLKVTYTIQLTYPS